MHDYFYCYSYRLMYFIKSNGIDYVKYGFNKKNGLKFYLFQRGKSLDIALQEWNNLKDKSKEDKL